MLLPKPLQPLEILSRQMLERAMGRLARGHEESIRHFQQAEMEILEGVRAFIEEELQFLDRIITRKRQEDPSRS